MRYNGCCTARKLIEFVTPGQFWLRLLTNREFSQREVEMARAVTTSTKLFGMIAMSMGMIDKGQLEECLEIQRKSGDSLRLGEVMLTKGILTEKDLERFLEG